MTAILDPLIALGTFADDGRAPFAGLVVDGRVWPIGEVAGLETLAGAPMVELFERWDSAWPMLARQVDALRSQSPAGLDLASLTPLLPVVPRQIVCAGANYRRHVIEMMTEHGVGSEPGLAPAERRVQAERLMDHRAAAGQPFAFVKPVSTLLAPGESLVVPCDSSQTDWELELAVVIGRPCYRVGRDQALDHVAGYAIANDVSARDRLTRADFPTLGLDWIAGKGAPGFLPLGPFIVPAAFVADPQDLMLTLRLNGETMQHESTADMIFPIARLIEFISTHMRLLPGDIVCTGSPSGNGTHYGRYLRDGDMLEGQIDGLGVQCVTCVGEQVEPGAPTHQPFEPLAELAVA